MSPWERTGPSSAAGEEPAGRQACLPGCCRCVPGRKGPSMLIPGPPRGYQRRYTMQGKDRQGAEAGHRCLGAGGRRHRGGSVAGGVLGAPRVQPQRALAAPAPRDAATRLRGVSVVSVRRPRTPAQPQAIAAGAARLLRRSPPQHRGDVLDRTVRRIAGELALFRRFVSGHVACGMEPESRRKGVVAVALSERQAQDGGSVSGAPEPARDGVTTRVVLQPVAAPSILGLYGFAGATFIVAANLAGWYGTKS